MTIALGKFAKEENDLFDIMDDCLTNSRILRRNSILAYFDDPRYRRKSSGITKYGTVEADSIVKKEDLIEYRGAKEFSPKYQIKVDRFFFLFPKRYISYPDLRP